MDKADKLYNEMKEIERKLKSMEVDSPESICEYFKLYTILIYNYKWLGSIYDIYDPNVTMFRGNGSKINSASDMVRDTTELLAAFPDLQTTISDIFVVPDNATDGYKMWRRFYLDGTNLGYSKYGPPTGKSLEGKKSMALSMSTLALINGKWKITSDFTVYSDEWIKTVCTK